MTHGNRYVTNYANAKAQWYGRLERGQRKPAGSHFDKKNFTVTVDSAVFGGVLFLMDGLPPGTRPQTGNWPYVIIMLDGSSFGDSEGVPDPIPRGLTQVSSQTSGNRSRKRLIRRR